MNPIKLGNTPHLLSRLGLIAPPTITKDPEQNWLLSGYPGSGKTHCLKALVAQYAQLGYRVLYLTDFSKNKISDLDFYGHLGSLSVINVAELMQMPASKFNAQS